MLMPPRPPVMRTRPSGSRVAVCSLRARCIEPVAVNVPVVGSNNCAAAVSLPFASTPPAIKTSPLFRTVAEGNEPQNSGVFTGQKPFTVNGFDSAETLPAVAASV